LPFIGEISALITAVVWSATSIMFTEATKKVSAVTTNIVRLFLATLFLGVTVVAFSLDMNLSEAQYFYLALSGVLGLSIGDTFLMKAFQKIGARVSMLIMALAPAMAALMAFLFLEEILSVWATVGILITLIGVAIVVLQTEDHNGVKKKICFTGILFAVLGAIGQAVGLIFAKKAFMESDINGFVASFIRLAASVLPLYLISLTMTNYASPFKAFRNDRKTLKLVAWGSFLSSYIGITLSLIAIAYAYVGIASTIMATAPIIMLPMVKYYYKENLSWKSIIGAFIAVAGVSILFLK